MHATGGVEEGIVPGGGVALIRCIPALDKLKLSDAKHGVSIIAGAVKRRGDLLQCRARGRCGGR
jgi:chaperonin GroEL